MNLPSPEGATPVMAQWFALKKEQPEALLFFRMGDFYELFFTDAEVAANALDIALTSRGTHAGSPIPMCGVPIGAASSYLARLIKQGFRVAIAEQMEIPSKTKKSSKGPLSRSIIRLVTPGTLTEDELLEAGQQNYLLCAIPDSFASAKSSFSIGAAWIDISTGFFETTTLKNHQFNDLLGRINPSEILTISSLALGNYENKRTDITAPQSFTVAQKKLSNLFHVKSLEALGDFSDYEIIAASMLVDYIQSTQNGKTPRLSRPRSQRYEAILAIDPATRSNLEILRSRDGGTQYTLLSSVCKTLTAPGARMLSEWLASPLTEVKRIERRQEGWVYLNQDVALLNDLRSTLRGIADIARALGRLSLGRGQPRDLAAIRDGLQRAQAIAEIIDRFTQKLGSCPPIIQQARSYLFEGSDLLQKLSAALVKNPPLKMEDGGFIAEGFDEQLDNYRKLRDHSRQIIVSLQNEYVQQFGVNNLKIRHHSQLGYIIEVTANASAKLRDRPELILRQGTANLARFTTNELVALNQKILEAAELADQQEKMIFETLVNETMQESHLPAIAQALALIDVLQSCTAFFATGRWCRPKVHEEAKYFKLVAARHPVVEAALDKKGQFTPNDCDLSNNKKVMLLTGPNMAGKSTFLRQVAIAVILAQSGLPVPAEKAEIGIVDRLFSRVGASDDLAQGRSTFMVEMIEAAAILNQAGPRSLVVIDEIGRGTSTLDGLAIAWAMLEALHTTIQCRTIFATHFHELVHSTQHLHHLQPFTMKVQEWKGTIIFQYEVIAGAAEHSWGIHVAQLAGVPNTMIIRAQQILNHLETERPGTQTSLPFEIQPTISSPTESNEISILKQKLKEVHPDQISPREALDILYELKKHVSE